MSATKSKISAWLIVEDPDAATSGATPTASTTPEVNPPFAGERRFEIAHYSSSSSLNSIPRARVKLATGRDAADGQTKAAVHEYPKLLKKMSRVKVMFRATGEYRPGLNWPDKDIVIFEGRVLSPGLEMSAEAGHYTLDLIHWLGDLDSSSMFGRDSHVGNPLSYTFRGFSSGRTADSGAGVSPTAGSFSTLSDYDILLDGSNVTEDLWGRVIKPIFAALVGRKIFKIAAGLESCFGDLNDENAQALAALSKMEGTSDKLLASGLGLDLSDYTPPLSLYTPDGLASDDLARVKDAIVVMLGNQSLDSMAQSTFWGKLVGQYSAALAFCMVPQAEKALVVPFTLGLRDTYCKEIRSDDYSFIAKADLQFRPLRAVAVLTVRMGMAGLLPPQIGDPGACYQPEDGTVEDGMVRIITPPEWLTNVPAVASDVLGSTGLKDEDEVNTPTTPIETSPDTAAAEAPVTLLTKLESYYKRYARWFFVNESLRGRTAQISGKLRFDIAPGSNIKLETVTEKHMREDSGDFISTESAAYSPTNFIATVVSVTINIDAEKNLAATGFVLTGVRTEEENASDKTSLDIHPLYGEAFIGAPLVPDLAFFEEQSTCSD